MKICFVTTVYSTYQCFLKQFSNYLHESGEFEISLICNEVEGLREDLPEFVHYYPVQMARGVSLGALGAVRKIKKILLEQEFDIVQYATPNAALYTSLAAKAAKIPVRLYCQWGIRYMGFEGPVRKLFKLLEKITCRCSTFIEAESHNIRKFSIEEGLYDEEKSDVIWNGSACGVDLEKFDISKRELWREEIRNKYLLSEEQTVFCFAGRLTQDKGINELLQAFLSLAEKRGEVVLFVIGPADDISSLNIELFEKARAHDRVIFTGNVVDIEKYYAASDVFVAPSYREGFGLVVIEAAALGLPAVISDVPGQVDAIVEGKTGVSCRVKNAAALEEAMLQLAEDEVLRTRMSENAHRYVEENYEQRALFEKLRRHREELIAGA